MEVINLGKKRQGTGRARNPSEEPEEEGGNRRARASVGRKRRKDAIVAETARRAEGEGREGHDDWQKELEGAVKSEQIVLAPDRSPPSEPSTPSAEPSSRTAPSEPPPPKKGGPSVEEPDSTPEPPESRERAPQPAITRAGTSQYNEFFGLYAAWVRNGKYRCLSLVEALQGEAEGTYFVPLGFIPGPAIILQFRDDGLVRMTNATPDVREWLANEVRKAEEAGKTEEAERLAIPTAWMLVEKLPSKVLHSISEWEAIIKALGYEPSPWNIGFAKRTMEGKPPSCFLSMVMPRFRFRSGDLERPFGVVLVPTKDGQGMKLERVHNPQGIPDVQDEGAVLTFEELMDGRGPLQKLLRTWALMDDNFDGRYDKEGKSLSQTRYGQRAPAR